ncbi:unnamed protein product [Caenorhabditis auriculariae]|uniref:Uncharacterized protein n=1 Tax=Caenorhabditis auriculariae TaxID=2777116 RepID=A0A8S1HKT5_9PELO|nr:unnamed protein product [Caenorhabditis auriculariae]
MSSLSSVAVLLLFATLASATSRLNGNVADAYGQVAEKLRTLATLHEERGRVPPIRTFGDFVAQAREEERMRRLVHQLDVVEDRLRHSNLDLGRPAEDSQPKSDLSLKYESKKYGK